VSSVKALANRSLKHRTLDGTLVFAHFASSSTAFSPASIPLLVTAGARFRVDRRSAPGAGVPLKSAAG
jgi:hypothetical protein